MRYAKRIHQSYNTIEAALSLRLAIRARKLYILSQAYSSSKEINCSYAPLSVGKQTRTYMLAMSSELNRILKSKLLTP